jgi:hypothetical protein
LQGARLDAEQSRCQLGLTRHTFSTNYELWLVTSSVHLASELSIRACIRGIPFIAWRDFTAEQGEE